MAVRINFEQAKLNKLTQAMVQALEMTAEAIRSDIIASQVVPKEKGTLERGGEVTVGKESRDPESDHRKKRICRQGQN